LESSTEISTCGEQAILIEDRLILDGHTEVAGDVLQQCVGEVW